MRIRFGWSTIFCALVFLATLRMVAQEKQAIRIPRADHAPRLEDFLNGNPGDAGLKITDFRQRKPRDGAPSSQATTAFLSYDDRNLYVVFVCQADARTLRAHMVKREDIAGDDSVSVSLDTFHDGQRAYEFFSNPLGIQLDGITAEGVDDDDFSFDTVWQSRGRITKDGYIVIFAIPFKSLRFHSRSARGSAWGIALGRVIPGNRELSTWPLLTEKIEAYVPQFASMESPEHAHAARNMEFVPYVFGAGEKFLDTTAVPPAVKTQQTYRGGLDAKIVLHDALTLDATVNPDFSQIESDEPQVTTNQRYEVFFPEKRPFFLENSDYFDTPETLLFTRRIVDPQYGLRLTGKVGNWKLGFLGVDDRAPGLLEPLTSPLRGDHAEIFAGRLQRIFSGSSNLGVMFTRRQFGGASTSLWSIDSRLKLGPNWILAGQFMQSGAIARGVTLDSANAIFAELRHVGRRFNSSTTYQDRDANFAGNDLGFFRRTDIRQFRQNLSYQWRPEGGALTSAGPLFSAQAVYDHNGVLQDWFADLPLQFNFKGPASFSFGRTESFERYQGIGFRKQSSYVTFSTDKLRMIGLRASYAQGMEINFFPAAGVLPALGNATDASAGITLKPVSRLQLEEKYIFSRLGDPIRRGVIFENHLLRSKLNYQLSRPMSFRVIVDYNALAGNPLLADLERTKRLNYDFLFTYLLHPRTALYIGYSDRYENLLLDPAAPLGLARTADLSRLTARQFFVKLSYAFRM
jgi:Domain of unknown function (DUF5916)